MGKECRVVALSCSHAPFVDWPTIKQACRIARDIKATHIIHLGDLHEADAASVHPGEQTHTLEDEYEIGSEVLNMMRHARPNAEHVWVLGNHDDNIQCGDPRRIPKDLRGVSHWSKHALYGSVYEKWRQIPYVKSSACVYKVGHFRFYHGFDVGVKSDAIEALQMRNATGCPWNTLWVRGHTHRPVQPTQVYVNSKTTIPYWYANVGHSGPAKPDYMRRKDTGLWGHGIFVGTTPSHWSSAGKWSGRIEV
jgi:predicted phosphodiesterase